MKETFSLESFTLQGCHSNVIWGRNKNILRQIRTGKIVKYNVNLNEILKSHLHKSIKSIVEATALHSKMGTQLFKSMIFLNVNALMFSE